MTAKEWLERGWGIDKEIEMLEREREAAFAAASRVCASYDTDKVQTSPGNSTERRFLKCVEYGEMIDRRRNELYEVKMEILSAINKIGDTKLRRLLILRYVNYEVEDKDTKETHLRTWEEIAKEMNYSVMQIYRLRGLALQKIEDVIKCY